MKVIRIPLAGLLAFTGCTGVFFRPTRQILIRPEDYGGVYKSARFNSLDGTELTGMFFPARVAPAKGTVVHFHGNAENMSSHFGFSFWLVAHGFNVFIFDYRGYGASKGRPGLKGSVRDCIAAVRYVRSREDVDADKVVVFAQSLGGALALATLSRMKDPGVKAIAIDSSFSSYRKVVQDKMSGFIPTWPLQWPLSALLFSTRYDPIKTLRSLPKVPLVFIHGTADRVVPYKESQRLFATANDPKELWTIEGGQHTDAVLRHGAEYQPKLADFFTRALKAH